MDDLYVENALGGNEMDAVLEELHALDRKIHHLRKRKKHGKHGKKKRLKKRIKQLEREKEQMIYFFLIYMQQGRMDQRQKPVNWQEALCSSLPDFVGLATSVVNKLPDKRNTALCLPEKK